MRFEGVYDHFAAQIPRALRHDLQNRAVTNVQAVEVPDRDDRSNQGPAERRGTGDDFQC